ncbi:MAG: NUDIX domain-containing protein [Candidatus Paceibacterota bacterium]|jgi:8-oxo-dGTP pyrophosphatase MutT (NUDIX family)
MRCFVVNEAGRLLLMKRSLSDPYKKGLWECPGGKVDTAEDLWCAGIREVEQETGFLVEPVAPLTYVDNHVIREGKYKGNLYVQVIGVARVIAGTLRLSTEHEAGVWISYDNVFLYDLAPKIKEAAIALKEYLTK